MKREELEKALVSSGWTCYKNISFGEITYRKEGRRISLCNGLVEHWIPQRNNKLGRLEFCLDIDKLILSNKIIGGGRRCQAFVVSSIMDS